MGYWFGKYSKCTSWRKTPAKIGNNWYTPNGERIRNPKAYFKAVKRNGRYWEGNTGWKESNRYCSHDEYSNDYEENIFGDRSNSEYNIYDDEEYYRENYSSHDFEDDRYDFKNLYGESYYDEFDDY